MTTPVRPPLFPPAAAAAAKPDPAKLAAQRAFFDMALGKAAAPAATAAPAAAPEPSRAATQTPSAAPSDSPQRILRPGSLLDIRV